MISDTISDIIGDMISDIVPDKDKGEAAVTGSVFRFYSGLTTDCVYFFEATSEHLNIFAFVKRIEYDFVPGHRLNPPVSKHFRSQILRKFTRIIDFNLCWRYIDFMLGYTPIISMSEVSSRFLSVSPIPFRRFAVLKKH